MTTSARLEFSTKWEADGRLAINISNGQARHADLLNPQSARTRDQFMKALDKAIPGLGAQARQEIQDHLVALAAEGPPVASMPQGSIVDPDPEPWHEAVDAARLLSDIVSMLSKHVVLPAHGAVTTALWILHSYVYSRFTYTPRLLLTSAVMRSGKTLLLRLVAALVARPLTAEGISAPALYRIVESVSPTLLLDEGDSFLQRRRDASEAAEAMRGVVNSGYQRGGRVIRCEGDNHEPRGYSTFAPVCIAMIGEPPATIVDRSIILRMRRRTVDEKVERIRPGKPLREQHVELVKRCRRWAEDHASMFSDVEPQIPDGLNDRQADCWWALLTIADAIGGDWPALAREAAVALSAVQPDDQDAAIQLLTDLRTIFGKEERLPTAEVLRRLSELEASPWATWNRGNLLNAHQMARLLKPFDVRPTTIRMPSGATPKGYMADSLHDAWDRYLPAPSP
jgi:hypothetical protein